MNGVAVALRLGVTVSFLLLTIGVGCAIGADAAPALRPDSVRELLRGLAAFEPSALIHAGLLVLLATPFARVVALVAQFARERDRPFVAVSFGVLLLLITTIMIGMMWEGSR